MRDRLWRWPIPMVIACIRRGTHDRADANRPCRGCATAVICRAASCKSRRACPLPTLLRTLHIGGSNLKSRATCVSRVPPRSHTDVPAPSGQRTCSMHPNHCYEVHAGAVRGCNLDQIAAITMLTHASATGAGVPDASLLLPAERVHPVCMSQETCSLQAHQPSRIGRQRPPGA
jgi:hypothetical protein